jgi:hypothetical protein
VLFSVFFFVLWKKYDHPQNFCLFTCRWIEQQHKTNICFSLLVFNFLILRITQQIYWEKGEKKKEKLFQGDEQKSSTKCVKFIEHQQQGRRERRKQDREKWEGYIEIYVYDLDLNYCGWAGWWYLNDVHFDEQDGIFHLIKSSFIFFLYSPTHTNEEK